MSDYNRLKNIIGHFVSIPNNISKYISTKYNKIKSCNNCKNNCSDKIKDIEDLYKTTINKEQIKKKINLIKDNHGLSRDFFIDKDIYEYELNNIFYKQWIFVGHSTQIIEKKMYFTLNIGKYPIIIIRDNNNEIKAYHNICRHRGLKLFDNVSGKLDRDNIVCMYHNWSYNINNGELKYARDMNLNDDFDKSNYGLLPINIKVIQTYIFICISNNPPNFDNISECLNYYCEPYNFNKTKIAYQSTIIENGNWKLVWENNRECYHCRTNHPELIQSFPANWIQSKEGDFANDDNKQKMKDLKLPYEFYSSNDYQFRFMRHFFVKDSTSMTISGKPAVKKTLGRIPENTNVGNVAFYYYPCCWNHFQSDYIVTFRVIPLTPTTTEVVTTWIVNEEAQENIDYDLKELTEVWLSTNKQDQILVERVQQGITSPSYIPGPFNKTHESGVIEFNYWYKNLLTNI